MVITKERSENSLLIKGIHILLLKLTAPQMLPRNKLLDYFTRLNLLLCQSSPLSSRLLKHKSYGFFWLSKPLLKTTKCTAAENLWKPFMSQNIKIGRIHFATGIMQNCTIRNIEIIYKCLVSRALNMITGDHHISIS